MKDNRTTLLINEPLDSDLLKTTLDMLRQLCLHYEVEAEFVPVRLDAPPPELPWFFHVGASRELVHFD